MRGGVCLSRRLRLLKIMRIFWGGYVPNLNALYRLKYTHTQLPRPIISVLNENQGFGQIKGFTQKQGVIYPNVPVAVFRRDNKLLLWETKSKADGSYQLRNIAKGLECFVVGFDPASQFNAVISDKVVAK